MMHRLPIALLALLAISISTTRTSQAQALPTPGAASLQVRGTDFRLALPGRPVLHGKDLVGATLQLTVPGPDGQPLSLQVRIDSAEHDPRDNGSGQPHDPDGEVWLFDLRTQPSTATGSNDPAQAWQPLCTPDPDGKQLGFPIAEPGDPSRLTLTCTSGAVAKCIRFGYAPWRAAPQPGGAPMADYHAACVNMLRGAYGGGERAWTRNGTQIDLYDRVGIQQPSDTTPLPFEAGWRPDGATCLAHPRILENGDLAAITAAVPRLSGHTGPEQCTETAAQADGALVFNRSRP